MFASEKMCSRCIYWTEGKKKYLVFKKYALEYYSDTHSTTYPHNVFYYTYT